MWRNLLALLSVILLLPAWILGQLRPGVLECYSTSRGGSVHHLLAKGDFLFAAEGSSLVVYDTHTPVYQRVFEKRFTGPITDMHLHKGMLYLTANHDGLSKWDISIPIKPAIAGDFRIDDFATGFQSLRFSNDTIMVVASTGIWMLQELSGIGASFEKNGHIAEQLDGRGRIVAGEWLGEHCVAAIAGKDKGIGQGIHAYRIVPESRLNFQHFDLAEPAGILRLPGTSRVIVFGGDGGEAGSALLGMDFADPLHPVTYFSDTVKPSTGIAAIRHGLLAGDTLLVPVVGRLHAGCADAPGAVAIYHMRDPKHPRWMGQIALPGAPEHVSMSGKRLFVAMGDLGIAGYDLTKWKPGECQALEEIGHSVKGLGGCLGADVMGDKMLTANGSAGMVMHLLQERKMLATRNFEGLGAVQQVRFLGDGSLAACWIANGAADSLVVVQLADGKVIGSLEEPVGHKWAKVWHDRIVVARDDKSGFSILDLRNPVKPRKEQAVLMNFNDIAVDALGRLVVSTEHNLRVFDLSGAGLQDVATFTRWGEGFGAVASDAESVYACTAKRGLVRYRLVKDSKGITMKEEQAWKLPQQSPQRMVIGAEGIYLVYNDFGVYAIGKQRWDVQGYYRTGLDFKGDARQGLQDAFYKDGRLFVVEYYGQVTALRSLDVQE